jgi:large subunit ribosomal protein L18
MPVLTRRESRIRRHYRVRNKVSGSAEKPRICVFRSNKHIYAQLVDDDTGHTIAAAGSLEPNLKGSINGNGGTVEAAKAVGKALAERAAEKGITEAVFDRGGYLYHGRVAALADAAREGGLKF